MQTVIILVTFSNRRSADRVARKLLDMRLVACANIVPSASIYHWKGKVVREKEVLVILITTTRLARKTMREIERLHPYEVPCIERFVASSNASCGKWIREVTTPRKRHA